MDYYTQKQTIFGSSTLIYKVKEEFKKRENFSKEIDNQNVTFFINYEELDKIHSKKQCRKNTKIKMNNYSAPRINDNNNRHTLQDSKPFQKVFVNFDCFNPIGKNKDHYKTLPVHPFQEILLRSKQKYIQKVQRRNHRKRSQNCSLSNPFGLNIKTMKQQLKLIKSSPIKTKKFSQSQIGLTGIENRSKKLKTICQFSKKKSISKQYDLVLFGEDLKQKKIFNNRLNQMINSANLLLTSFGCFLDKKASDVKYKYFVGQGNNRNLIVSIMKKRWWWIETNDSASAQLVWTQLKHKPAISKQPNCKQLGLQTNSDSFNTSQRLYYKLFSTPITKSFSLPSCIHNHFQHNYMLGNKNALFQNLSLYYAFKKLDVWSIIPLTYFVSDVASKQFKQFSQEALKKKKTIWVVKPGQNSNRGQGIFVTRSLQEITAKLSHPKSKKCFIIQKYITNLLLYQRRKFDIRTYLLQLTIGGTTKFFWYNQGYLRTSSQIFDLRNLTDSFVHLTNDAIQINSGHYGRFEDGNKVTYNQFQRYLDFNFPEGKYSVKQLNEKMKRIAQITVKATYSKLDPNNKAFGFELFGLDFIVDNEFKPWLIEVNTNPCLELTSPILSRLIPVMLENLFRIAVDPIFQAKKIANKSGTYYFYENCMDKTKFEPIFDSLIDRDFEWQAEVQRQKEKQKVYEDDNELFQGNGQQITVDY